MNAIDSVIISAANSFSQKSWIFDHAVNYLSRFSLLKGGVLATIFWWLWSKAVGVDDKIRERLFATVFAMLCAIVLARCLALCMPLRLRPMNNPEIHFLIPFGAQNTALNSWSSFPSDHATMFFAFATGILFISRTIGISLLAYSLIIVCLPRIYLGLHFPTDTFAGCLLGAAITGIAQKSPLRTLIARPLLRWHCLHPCSFYACLFLVTYQMADMFDGFRSIGHSMWYLLKISVRYLTT